MHFYGAKRERDGGRGGEGGGDEGGVEERESDLPLLVGHSGALLRSDVVGIWRRCSSSGVRLCVSAYLAVLVKGLLVKALLVLAKALLVLLLRSTPVCLRILSAPTICVRILSCICPHT
jgi:hypothetical protein